jgi:molecular chaperone GrpE
MSENNQKTEDTQKTEENDQDINNKSKKIEIPEVEKREDNILEAKLKESEDRLLRSLAEIENQRRRFEKEIKDAFEYGSFNFAKESLAILDNLERARLAIKNDEKLKENKDLDKFLENINIIEKDLITIFEKNRIKRIDTRNKRFDPNLHQAMSEIENDEVETGSILQEIQAGYMLGERLLRPALVGVAKKKTSNNEEKKEKKEDK